tara:strand:- start:189 stop:416 length:228 start_codon:yes stop_codon:yes gene_type:complete
VVSESQEKRGLVIITVYLREVRLHPPTGAVGEVTDYATLPVSSINSALNGMFGYDIQALSIEVNASLDPLRKAIR